jgi:PAS domain S-box-containing protein
LAYGLGELSQLAQAFDQMAETLEHEQGFMHILLENLSDGVIACNAEGQLTLFNRTARNWYGQEANGSPPAYEADNPHFDDPERVNQLLAEDSPLMRAFRGEQVRQAEMAIVSPGQPRRYLLVNGDPLFDSAGRKLGAVVVMHDITERKQAVEALQDSRSRLAGIIGSTMDAIITVDAEQRIVLFNAAAEQMFRCSAAEVLGQPLDRFIPSQFRDLHRQHIRAFGRTKVSNRSMGALGAITGLRADGQEFPIEASISQVEAAGQRLYTVILRDITERKRAEEQIQRQTARAKALMNIAARLNAQLNLETVLTTVCEETAHALKVSATAVRLYDPKQDILYYANAFGLPPNYKEYTQPSPGSLYRELIQQHGKLIIATDVQNIPGVPNVKLYACLNIYMVVTALMFREGQLVGALNLFTFDQARHFTEDELSLLTGLADQAAQAITNARLYAQLEAANQELAYSNTELQQFAYVASHDLQEPLRMVASYTQLLARRYRGKLDSDADEFISYAVDGANRMQRLINDLLSYSRLGTQGKPLELTGSESALAQALANLQLAIAENEAVVSHDPLPTVWADETQLVQLFQNLVGNAIKFRSTQPPRIHISAEQKEREWLFSVSDNGIGIEPEYAERIFVIFQRLHSQAEYSGTGIGLAFCKRIVERHGGRIWMESQPGQGATFYFTLPVTGGET